MSPTNVELCFNCGQLILRSEQACLVRGKIVCAECDKLLRSEQVPQPAPSPEPFPETKKGTKKDARLKKIIFVSIGAIVVVLVLLRGFSGPKYNIKYGHDIKYEYDIKYEKPLIVSLGKSLTRFQVAFQKTNLRNVPVSNWSSEGFEKGDNNFVTIYGKVMNLGPRESGFYIDGEIKTDNGNIYDASFHWYAEKKYEYSGSLQQKEERTFFVEAAIPQGAIPIELFGCFKPYISADQDETKKIRLKLPRVKKEESLLKENLAGVYINEDNKFGYEALELNPDGTFRDVSPGLGNYTNVIQGTWEIDGQKIKFYKEHWDHPIQGKLTIMDGKYSLWYNYRTYVKKVIRAEEQPQKTFYEQAEEDRQRFLAEPKAVNSQGEKSGFEANEAPSRITSEPVTEGEAITTVAADANAVAETTELYFAELSKIDKIEAERLLNAAVPGRSIGRLPMTGFKLMVDSCRQIISKWPDSWYAYRAKQLLADMPERFRERYKVTKEELDVSEFTKPRPGTKPFIIEESR